MAVGFPTKVDYATGDVLSAGNMNDLSGTVNLLESAQYAAGKNKIINGDFNVNQRNFTTGTTNAEFNCDRMRTFYADGTVTTTVNTFTLGAAPVTGYEGKNFVSIQSTGQTLTTANSRLIQDIESVRTLANETATISFWAKAASGTPKIAVELSQDFGDGGSPSADVTTYAGQVTISTSWARYSVTVAVPSISGKTLGTNGSDFLRLALWTSAGSSFNSRTGSLGIQTNTISFWGLQVEEGSTASAFQTATGTIQGELAACQRYYYRQTSGTNKWVLPMCVSATSTTAGIYAFALPVTMRTTPTSIDTSAIQLVDGSAGYAITSMLLSADASPAVAYGTLAVASGLTTRAPYSINSTGAAGYVGFSAEI
jgi:hypothetical protein